jgi:hypothetical protein
MTSTSESSTSNTTELPSGVVPTTHNRLGWLRVGAVAAASAVLGGMAAAWYYRKTLAQLREAETALPATAKSAIEDDSAEDF